MTYYMGAGMPLCLRLYFSSGFLAVAWEKWKGMIDDLCLTNYLFTCCVPLSLPPCLSHTLPHFLFVPVTGYPHVSEHVLSISEQAGQLMPFGSWKYPFQNPGY